MPYESDLSPDKNLCRGLATIILCYACTACEQKEKSDSETMTLQGQTDALIAMAARAAMDSGLGANAGGTELPPPPDRGASLDTLDQLAAEWDAIQQDRTGELTDETEFSEPETYWAIALKTFTRDNHVQAATTMLGNLPKVAPQIQGARVHTNSKGSMVIHGRFKSFDDPEAKKAMQNIRSLKVGRQRVFRQVMMAKITTDGGRIHPHDLRMARAKYPNVDPLLTVQVALWGNFDSGKYTLKQIRSMARKHVAQLRAQGYEAYFHHDDALELSTVTVGLFGNDAVDPATGLKSSAVMEVLRKFPDQLVNGETLEVPIDKFSGKTGKVQSGLVNVPEK